MEKSKKQKFLLVLFIVIGTSPLGTMAFFSLASSILGPFVLFLMSFLIYFGTIYTFVYCFRRLEALGYSKQDFFRFFVPLYGIYFAYQFASKLSSAENLDIPTSPKKGKGLNF